MYPSGDFEYKLPSLSLCPEHRISFVQVSVQLPVLWIYFNEGLHRCSVTLFYSEVEVKLCHKLKINHLD